MEKYQCTRSAGFNCQLESSNERAIRLFNSKVVPCLERQGFRMQQQASHCGHEGHLVRSWKHPDGREAIESCCGPKLTISCFLEETEEEYSRDYGRNLELNLLMEKNFE